ncbi:MAG: hypothetical protein AB2A00_01990 [Myxococcota bacterium]
MPRYVEVMVEAHDAIPEDCCMRYAAISEDRTVTRVHWTPGREEARLWLVEGVDEDDAPCVARAATVEDSGAGSCVLVRGGSWGLRLRRAPGDAPLAEPYLLLPSDAVLE